MVCISLGLYAQNSGIKGIVTGGSTEESLIAATVAVGTSGTATDFDGTYTYDLEPGTYDVTFSYVGFDDLILTVDVPSGQYVELNAELAETTNLLNQVTVTGSKYEKKITDSPVSISVLSPDWIESTNTTDVTSIIDKTPGVQIIDGQANIRGGAGWSYGAGSRVMLLIDEIPALQADAGRPSWGDIPVENIKQIEVIKGASSVLYGSSALNGIIHVRTKYATSVPETKIVTSYTHFMSPSSDISNSQWWGGDSGFGSPYEATVSALHKQKFGKLDVVLHGFYATENNYYRRDPSQVEEGVIPGHMESSRMRFGMNLKYRLSDRITFKLGGLYTNNHSEGPFLWNDIPGNYYTPFGGGFTSGDNLRYYVDPELVVFDKAGNRHKLYGRLYNIENDNNNDQSNTSFTSYGEYQFLRNFESLGAVLTTGLYTSSAKSDSPLFGDEEVTERNVAWYAQVDKKIGEKINFTAGIRVENYEQKSDQFITDDHPEDSEGETQAIGRLGLTYDLAEFTFLRASIGQGYRYPSIAERFITTRIAEFGIFQNPDLISEKGWSSEIGVKQGWALAGIKGFVDVSAFWSQYQQMMEFNFVNDPASGVNGFQSRNVGDTDIKGVEFNIAGTAELGKFPCSFLAGYTYIDPRYTNLDEDPELERSLSAGVNVLKYRSKHNVKADFETGFKDFKIGATVAHISNVVNVDAFLEALAGIRQYRALDDDGYVTLDARISYEFKYAKQKEKRHIKISVVGKNMTNEYYTQRPAIMQAPRNISARLELSF